MAKRLVMILSLLAIGGPLLAQTQPKPAAPPAAKQNPPAATPSGESPQRTSATYDDWVEQCEMRAGTPPEKVCEIGQVAMVQGRNVPFSRLVVPRPAKGQTVRLVAQTPVNVLFARSMHIKGPSPEIDLVAPFARCIPAGCFADFEIKDDDFKKFRANSGPGQMSFTDSAGQDIIVPISFKGLAQAFDALVKE